MALVSPAAAPAFFFFLLRFFFLDTVSRMAWVSASTDLSELNAAGTNSTPVTYIAAKTENNETDVKNDERVHVGTDHSALSPSSTIESIQRYSLRTIPLVLSSGPVFLLPGQPRDAVNLRVRNNTAVSRATQGTVKSHSHLASAGRQQEHGAPEMSHNGTPCREHDRVGRQKLVRGALHHAQTRLAITLQNESAQVRYYLSKAGRHDTIVE